MQNSSYVESILGEFGFLSASESAGAAFSFRWKIDPSGYVYDVSDNSRLPGVTATAYWIEYTDADSDDSFWDHAPSSTEYGTKWDASDWDEINPLTTDANGAYSWTFRRAGGVSSTRRKAMTRSGATGCLCRRFRRM